MNKIYIERKLRETKICFFLLIFIFGSNILQTMNISRIFLVFSLENYITFVHSVFKYFLCSSESSKLFNF